MTKIQEVVKRSQWFSAEDFDRDAAIDEVEAALRDRHDLVDDVDVEVTTQMSGGRRVAVSAPTVDQDGDAE